MTTTYIDAAPVHEHLRKLRAAGASMYRIAQLADIPSSNVRGLVHRRQKRVRSDNAALILNVTAEAATAPRPAPTPVLDHATLATLLDGAPTRVEPKDKPAYVRALHAHGWTKFRISRALSISGTDINNALAAEEAA